jgi:hypothetical protein
VDRRAADDAAPDEVAADQRTPDDTGCHVLHVDMDAFYADACRFRPLTCTGSR